ncbi:hypothetical protein [Streptomyces formicae]|uniref:Putative membrane protein n=1 Tax=Streptomyces formicae TaxID=1616117 RepID=A0A291Q7L9_9ACTN|nr:hypothetical protein [Streptomyces formicae]ATL27721.1 putative membrane protein [Streptomyces formicae]
MEHTPTATWVTEAAKAAGHQGPGNLLRVVLIVSIVGCVLVAWVLLRGYRQGADDEGAGTNKPSQDTKEPSQDAKEPSASANKASEGAREPSESVNQGRGDADEDRNG